MSQSSESFPALIRQILGRYCAQNGRDPTRPELLAAYGLRLDAMVRRRGLPRPLAEDEMGSPGELPERECEPLLAELLGDTGGNDRVFFATPLRQLIKTCFHGEFKICRDSYREASPDGICRRQQLSRARQRISGTHCIDCPYWVSLPREAHAAFLRGAWRPAAAGEFSAHQTIFLPEDFRRLRRYLHDAARSA